MTKVVISGIGLTTGFGIGVDPFWSGLVAGKSCFNEMRRFDGSRYRNAVASELTVPLASDSDPELSRKDDLAQHALVEAMRTASLETLPSDALVVLVGQGPCFGEGLQSAPGVNNFVGPTARTHEWLARPTHRVYLSHACASAATGITFAREWLTSGLASLAVVLGSSPLTHYELGTLHSMLALSRSGARPFDIGRDGTTVGEGSGAVILESERALAERNGTPLVTVAGSACRAGAGETSSEPKIVEDCIMAALNDAKVDEVGYVHAHATGTLQGDEAELAAIDRVAAQYCWPQVPISAHKGAIGHMLHSSAFAAVATATRCLREQIVPGTPRLQTGLPSTNCRLLTASEKLSGAPAVLVNSFGFSGNNCCLVLT